MNYQATLKKKLDSLFVDSNSRAKARQLLEEYGCETHEREPFRVRLAVLKLSGADFARIEELIELARTDYRDILAMAEYPRESALPFREDGPAKQALRDADLRDYREWLDT